MTSVEVQELLNKVKMYRPFYEGSLGNDTFIRLRKDWTKALEKYKYEDVDERLEEFFRDDNNNNKIPNPYQLRDGLIIEEVQERQAKYKIACMFCGRWLDGNSMRKHEDRCRSINYLDKMYARFNRVLPRKVELYDMSDEEFDSRYYTFLENILKLLSGTEKEYTEKAIESYKKEKGLI